MKKNDWVHAFTFFAMPYSTKMWFPGHFSIQKCDFALINSIQKCDLNKNNIKKKDWQVPSGLENRVDKMPSIISGVRQIGKTTSIREFEKTYKSFIEINLVTESY